MCVLSPKPYTSSSFVLLNPKILAVWNLDYCKQVYMFLMYQQLPVKECSHFGFYAVGHTNSLAYVSGQRSSYNCNINFYTVNWSIKVQFEFDS